ncbi:MAG: ABC-type transport system involved in gliding motility, permease component [Verrucomicrobiota bacterium]|jgi:ABC-2 type transport system permease protein
MNIFMALLRRELGTFFYSLTGYVIIASVALLMGMGFVVMLNNLGNAPSPMPVTESFYNTFYFWLIVLLSAPVITMRLFALEKATGTFETLMTTPVGDAQVVAAKFSAAIIFYLVTWLPLLACLIIVRHFTQQTAALDTHTLGATYLGIFLVGSLFISLGCFASSLTRSQMAAAMIAFVLGMGLFSLGFLAMALPADSDWQTQALAYFNLFDQMHDFARGVVDTRAVIFYVSTTFVFLFLTLRVVESRRWK